MMKMKTIKIIIMKELMKIGLKIQIMNYKN